MKRIHKLALLLSASYLGSCSNQPSIPKKTDSLRSSISMAGQIYFFAPEFDSTNLVATGDCDCCAANTLFLNDSNFLEIEYCEDGSTFSMGKYLVDDRSLSLFYDSVTVNTYLPDIEDTAYTKYEKPIEHFSMVKSQIRTYQKKQYKGVNLFLNKDVGAPDKERKYGELLKSIHDDGIWNKLNINPSSIPRNSAAIEVNLQGRWASPGDTIANFKIMEDSIYYFRTRQKLPYKINHDSLRILLAQNELVYPVKILGSDTLIFEGREKQIYYRFYKYDRIVANLP